MKQHVTVRNLIKYAGHELQTDVVAGEAGLDRQIKTAESNRPGLALCGYYEHFGHDRVQIFGHGEVGYLESLSATARFDVLNQLLSYPLPCIVVTSGLCPPEELIDLANRNQITVLTTVLASSTFTTRLLLFFEDEFGPSEYVHGNLVDVFGVGVLILGQSGIGKSECTLGLLQSGHRVIADDTVLLKKVSEHRVFGIRPRPFKHYIEVRGIGIIDVVALFGVTAVGDRKQVELVATLEPWNKEKAYNRTGVRDDEYIFHNERLPHVVIPVRPGRNLANLIEVAAMSFWGDKLGLDAAKEFDSALVEMTQDKNDEVVLDQWRHETLHREIVNPSDGKR